MPTQNNPHFEVDALVASMADAYPDPTAQCTPASLMLYNAERWEEMATTGIDKWGSRLGTGTSDRMNALFQDSYDKAQWQLIVARNMFDAAVKLEEMGYR